LYPHQNCSHSELRIGSRLTKEIALRLSHCHTRTKHHSIERHWGHGSRKSLARISMEREISAVASLTRLHASQRVRIRRLANVGRRFLNLQELVEEPSRRLVHSSTKHYSSESSRWKGGIVRILVGDGRVQSVLCRLSQYRRLGEIGRRPPLLARFPRVSSKSIDILSSAMDR
jgi:hypothetical protein